MTRICLEGHDPFDYEGPVDAQGLPCGEGKGVYYQDGKEHYRYEGSYKAGLRQGFGRLWEWGHYPNPQDKHDGVLSHGSFDSNGAFYPDPNYVWTPYLEAFLLVYEGEWVDDHTPKPLQYTIKMVRQIVRQADGSVAYEKEETPDTYRLGGTLFNGFCLQVELKDFEDGFLVLEQQELPPEPCEQWRPVCECRIRLGETAVFPSDYMLEQDPAPGEEILLRVTWLA